jgi:hypothetical protein
MKLPSLLIGAVVGFAICAALFMYNQPGQTHDQANKETVAAEPREKEPSDKVVNPFNVLREFRPSPAANWDEQQIYQRGIEAVIWAMPAASMSFFRDSAFKTYEIGDNDVIAFSQPIVPRHELLTSNNNVPYVFTFLDLKNGPVVMEIPAATETAELYGQMVDAWQVSVADIGPSGEDVGKGGKYLFTPPGWSQKVPAGYLHVPSKSYRHVMMARSVKKGKATDADAHAYAQRIRIYPLAKADDPPPTRFVDGFPKAWNTLPRYDLSFFRHVAELVNYEPARPRDKAVLGMLRTLGIEHGKPFQPDKRMAEILERSIMDARAILERNAEIPERTLSPYWRDRHWMFLATDPTRLKGFSYETETALYVDDRAGMFYGTTFLPKSLLAGGAFYLCCLRDAEGKWLYGDHTYRLRLPADVPVRRFWSVTLYSVETKAFVFSKENRPSLSSFDRDKMNVNKDGSVDLYLGPKAPEGYEANWIPTANRDFFLFFRFYGPKLSIFDRSFKLADVERVD